MYAKLKISGEIELLTGMHIGGTDQFSAIGAIDSPIFRDVSTNLPMIPGTSLKGKLRTLLAKKYSNGLLKNKHEDDAEIIKRMFGSSKKGDIKNSRFIFSDMILCNGEELIAMGCETKTEIKFENTINRLTAVANPRQIERAIKGSKFKLDIIYDLFDIDEGKEDIKELADGFKLLQYDYLGGHGSRGYGKVDIKNLSTEIVIGEVEDEFVNYCNNILKEV